MTLLYLALRTNTHAREEITIVDARLACVLSFSSVREREREAPLYRVS